ncbi:uncharacterized protein [Drosophila virilis]|uniref:Uncharacterized protein, isoform A n=2 Tax=Drosophila virilis TaxID=7244 RepID=B4LPP4_DROVI|nr:uncharacterized protein LOC6625323 isoform X1 [Drosophila virilis]EDW60282.1 uncharacterized protein Dvir_GJ21396, isoform A [Drosophila virilis]
MKSIALITLLFLALEAVHAMDSNLTAWRQHRRQKRFLIYQDGGVIKMVTGTAFPVDFQEKNAWRQLVWLMNYHYQFSEPTKPIYWWNLWNGRDLKGPLKLTKDQEEQAQANVEQQQQVDEPQQLLYEFAEEYMNQRGQDGKACLKRAICENGQVHEHNGLYAQLLHRLLRPHRSLATPYLDAYRMGKHGVDCRQAYPTAAYCLLDDYVHVHERGLTQSFV